MTQYFVGPSGSDAANGTTYALRKLTMTGAEALSLVAGDDVIVAPGVYPETLTLTKSGGNAYTTGTVNVTNGSPNLTFTGATLSGNVFAEGVFQVRTFVNGTDGVTTGSDATFVSAAGNFQAGMVGYVLSVMTKGAYRIATFVDSDNITLENADGTAAAPTAGTGLTYSIAQPESPYDILSVDTGAGTAVLKKPWSGPTLINVPYRCWRPIRFIADLTGYLTDGVGGPVVLTGSNDQATQTRTAVLSVNSRTQRTFRGFAFQLGTQCVELTTASDFILEDFLTQGGGALNTSSITITGLCTGNTFRRGIIQGGRGVGFGFFNATAQDDAKLLIENVLIIGGVGGNMAFGRYGNSCIRNCTITNAGIAANTASSTLGQAVVVNNNLLIGNGLTGLNGTATWFFEDYNAVWGAATAHGTGTTVGAHTLTTTAPLLDIPLLTGNGHREDWNPWDLQSVTATVSPLRNKASGPYPYDDLYGSPRPQGTLPAWGAIEPSPRPVRETVIVRNGTSALQIPGRGFHDMLVPVTFGQAITITAWSRHATDASIGLRPRIRLLADYGLAEQTDTAAGDGTAFEELTIGPVTPVAPATGNTDGGMMVLRLENQNTHTADIAVYFDDIAVS